MTTALLLPRLRADQYQIATHPAKVKVLCMGRRWGKSVLAGTVCLLAANAGARVAWIVPTYKNGRPLWRWAESTVGNLKRYGVEVNRSERTIEFPNGGGLGLYSADNADSIRSERFQLAVLDEAAKIPFEAYVDAIQPTLADLDGDVFLISTPRGKNWFFNEWQAAASDGVHAAAWRAATSDNPNPNIRAAFEQARLRVPERSFRQEWLAEFVEDGGEVFRNVRACATAVKQAAPVAGHEYLIGVDLAKVNDFTVLAVFDVTLNALVYLDRFNQIDYTVQLARLQALSERFAPRTVVIEDNVGQMFIEQAQRAGLPVMPFHTSAATKPKLIDDLTLAFERQTLQIIPDEALISELEAFSMERTTAGSLRYSAPPGMHDDTVIALALAWHGVQSGIQTQPFTLDISW